MEAAQVQAPAESAEQRPNGPVAAGMLAAGIGALVLGALTTITEASESFAETLQLVDRVGPLSGKTLIASGAFILSWAVLAVLLRDRDLPWKPLLWGMGVLIALGILGTFPTFFQAFASE